MEYARWSSVPLVFDSGELRRVLKLGPADSDVPVSAWLAGFRRRCGLTQSELAATVGVTLRTAQNWEGGSAPRIAARKTKDLRELNEVIAGLMDADQIRDWLRAPLPAHQNQTALDLMTSGRIRDLIVSLSRALEGVS